MKPTAQRTSIAHPYRVGCEPERPYSRMQIAWLRFLGLVLGRHIV